MKIRTLTIVTAAAALLIAVVVAVVLWVTTVAMNDAVARNEVANELVQVAFQRIASRLDYVLYHEQQAETQWRSLNQEVEVLLRRMLKEYSEPQTRTRLEGLAADTAAADAVFSRMVDNWNAYNQGKIDQHTFQSEQDSLVSQLTLQAQELVTAATRLSNAGTKAIKDAHTNETWSVGILILLLALFVVASTIFSGRTITSQLNALQDGVDIIAMGDLDYRVPVRHRNEVGELAGDINEMAARLRDSYTSLELEVAERRRSQDEVTRLNEDLRRRAAELEANTEELESFAYAIAHDLRTPLRAIDGFSQVILEDHSASLDDVGRSLLERNRAASQHMAQLLDDLLNISQVMRSEMHLEPVNLSDIADRTMESLRRSEPSRQVEFRNTPGIVVTGDASLLQVVMQNLLSNAWKFTSENDAARIEFGFRDIDGEWVCYVRDNGVGFDTAYVNKLFTPFQRLHDRTEFPGTGVGLATVQRIIGRHGGTVWADGKPGHGATFYFKL